MQDEITPEIDRVIHKALIDASPTVEYLEAPMPDDVSAMAREYLRNELLRRDMPICAKSVMSDDPDRLGIPPSVAQRAIEAAITATAAKAAGIADRIENNPFGGFSQDQVLARAATASEIAAAIRQAFGVGGG